MSIKKDILWRIRLAFLLLCLTAGGVILQTLKIQIVEGDKWRDIGKNSTKIDTIEGERGNMYSEDGRLLATSLPYFEIRMDLNATGLTDTVFNNEIDSLAFHLADYFGDMTQEEYREKLVTARADTSRYLLIQKKVDYNDLLVLKTWPIFRRGKYKGGLIAEITNNRVNPFNLLAKRTIGYARENAQSIGLEGSYDQYLRGATVPRSLHRVSGGAWVPIFDDYNLEARNGKDVYTTIDVNLQDVVENALLRAVRQFDADHGSAAVMEVKTGKIKAIANLGLGTDSTYWEKYNYVVGEKTEPGSTFKIAALTALLDDDLIDENTIVDIENGVKEYYDTEMRDASYYPYNEITLTKVIEISSNVGISKFIGEHYGENPQAFLDKLTQFGIDKPTGIEILGEPMPVVQEMDAAEWNPVTLPWMSIGYGLELTPLQLLTFVNAIANDGRMMKPYLVNEVRELNTPIVSYKPRVLKKQICKKETAQRVRALLKGVVERGTAKSIYSPEFSMAGKTGTAKIAKDKRGYDKIYQASFVGFFPADEPKYSCIVVINAPKGNDYYGGTVAAPVFKEIVEKYYSSSIDTYQPVNSPDEFFVANLPLSKKGRQEDIVTVYNHLGISNAPNENTHWVESRPKHNSIALEEMRMIDNLIPNVQEMGLRDALYLLENKGMKVKFTGKGKVVHQSPRSGVRYKRGDIVVLELK